MVITLFASLWPIPDAFHVWFALLPSLLIVYLFRAHAWSLRA